MCFAYGCNSTFIDAGHYAALLRLHVGGIAGRAFDGVPYALETLLVHGRIIRNLVYVTRY